MVFVFFTPLNEMIIIVGNCDPFQIEADHRTFL